jgi:hypothetical protein
MQGMARDRGSGKARGARDAASASSYAWSSSSARSASSPPFPECRLPLLFDCPALYIALEPLACLQREAPRELIFSRGRVDTVGLPLDEVTEPVVVVGTQLSDELSLAMDPELFAAQKTVAVLGIAATLAFLLGALLRAPEVLHIACKKMVEASCSVLMAQRASSRALRHSEAYWGRWE